MPFLIKIDRNWSFSALLNKAAEGFSVIKSPHAGNWYPNNLLAAKLGIRCSVYDRNYGGADRLFYPHLIICNGKQEAVGQASVLMTHSKSVKDKSDLMPELNLQDRTLADFHLASLRQAVPTTQAELYTDYLFNRQEKTLSLLDQVADFTGHLWERMVMPDGSIKRFCPGNVDWLKIRSNLFGLTNQTFGWVIPNQLNVFLDGILEYLDHPVAPVVYHLSGPAMYAYIEEYFQILDLCYDAVRNHFNLPETLTMVMVPVADMRWVVLESEKEKFEDVWLAWEEYSFAIKEKDEAFKMGAGSKSLVNQVNGRGLNLQAALLSCPTIFYDTDQANFLTQYDLLKAGQSLYVPPQATEVTFQEAAEVMKIWRRLKDVNPGVRSKKHSLAVAAV